MVHARDSEAAVMRNKEQGSLLSYLFTFGFCLILMVPVQQSLSSGSIPSRRSTTSKVPRPPLRPLRTRRRPWSSRRTLHWPTEPQRRSSTSSNPPSYNVPSPYTPIAFERDVSLIPTPPGHHHPRRGTASTGIPARNSNTPSPDPSTPTCSSTSTQILTLNPNLLRLRRCMDPVLQQQRPLLSLQHLWKHASLPLKA